MHITLPIKKKKKPNNTFQRNEKTTLTLRQHNRLNKRNKFSIFNYRIQIRKKCFKISVKKKVYFIFKFQQSTSESHAVITFYSLKLTVYQLTELRRSKWATALRISIQVVLYQPSFENQKSKIQIILINIKNICIYLPSSGN